MAYIVVISNENGREAKVIQSDEAVIKLVEERIREGVSEDSIQVYSGELVPFTVEKVPVVKLEAAEEVTTSSAADANPGEEAAQEESQDLGYSGFSKFNEEQVFSLDS